MSLLGGRLRPSNLRERVSSSAGGVGVRKERSSVCNKLSGQHRGFDMNYQGSNPDSAPLARRQQFKVEGSSGCRGHSELSEQ